MCETVDLLLIVGEDCGGEWGEEWCGYVVAEFKEKLEWFERLLGSFLVVRKVVKRGEQGEPEVMWERGEGKCQCRRAFSGAGFGFTRAVEHGCRSVRRRENESEHERCVSA